MRNVWPVQIRNLYTHQQHNTWLNLEYHWERGCQKAVCLSCLLKRLSGSFAKQLSLVVACAPVLPVVVVMVGPAEAPDRASLFLGSMMAHLGRQG